MTGLILKSKKQVEKLKAQQTTNLGYFKPTYTPKGTGFVFICPIKNEDATIVTPVKVFEAYGLDKKQLTPSLVSPTMWGETSDIESIGWNLKDKYKDDKARSKVHEYFIPKTKNVIFVIDPAEPKKGILKWDAPKAIADFLIAQVNGNDDGGEEGDMSFAHPTTGKLLKWTKEGTGFQTKYTNVGWANKKLDLGDITEEKLVEMLAEVPDVLGGTYKKPTPEKIKTYKDFLDEYAKKKNFVINWKNPKNSNLDGATSDDDDTSTNVAGVDDDDLDIADEKNKKGKGKANSAKPADDDDADASPSLDDEDAGSEIEVDLDDDADDSED